MQFDPFGDFETHGYLRNSVGEKDLNIVRQLEHANFLASLPAALNYLATQKRITYRNFLEVHRILFEDFYEWAGQDRTLTAPESSITKGGARFVQPSECERMVTGGLELGQDKAKMSACPGEVMSLFAYGHPFLDGNGRTMLIIHTELCHRAGFSIRWHETDKSAYLEALTRDLADPKAKILDSYLLQFVGPVIARAEWQQLITGMRGLGESQTEEDVTDDLSDVAVQQQQQEYEARRNYRLE